MSKPISPFAPRLPAPRRVLLARLCQRRRAVRPAEPDELAARIDADLPDVPAGRRLQGAGVPLPHRRQRFVQPPDSKRHRALQHLQHIAQRSAAGWHGDRPGQPGPDPPDDARQRRRHLRPAPELRQACALVRGRKPGVRRQHRHAAAAHQQDAVSDAGLVAAAAVVLACRSAGPVAVRATEAERNGRLGRARRRSPERAQSGHDDSDVDLAERPESHPGRRSRCSRIR